jgi:hypothetical protein
MSKQENYVASAELIQGVWLQEDSVAIEESLILGKDHEPIRAYYPFTSVHETWPPTGLALKAEVSTAVKELSMRVILPDEAPSANETYQIGPYYIVTPKSVIRGIAVWAPFVLGEQDDDRDQVQ